MSKNPNIKGIGGWLGLLILGMTILGPLSGLGNMTSEFDNAIKAFPQLSSSPQWLQYQRVSWVILLITIAVSISAGYRLWRVHTSQSVTFAVFALWFSGPVANLLYIITAISIFHNSNVNAMVPGVISSAIVAFIWTTYLFKSVRVKNTYNYDTSLE